MGRRESAQHSARGSLDLSLEEGSEPEQICSLRVVERDKHKLSLRRSLFKLKTSMSSNQFP